MIFLVMRRDRDGQATRADLLRLIKDRPGIHKMALCDATGLAWGTVHYHLRVLEKARTIVIDASRREARVFPQGMPARHRAWIHGLANPHGTRILGELADAPGQAVSELSDRLGLSPKVIRTHLNRMHEHGLVERQGHHRPQYRPKTEAGHGELADLLDRFA